LPLKNLKRVPKISGDAKVARQSKQHVKHEKWINFYATMWTEYSKRKQALNFKVKETSVHKLNLRYMEASGSVHILNANFDTSFPFTK